MPMPPAIIRCFRARRSRRTEFTGFEITISSPTLDILMHEQRAATPFVIAPHRDRVGGLIERIGHQRVRVQTRDLSVLHFNHRMRPAREGGQQATISAQTESVSPARSEQSLRQRGPQFSLHHSFVNPLCGEAHFRGLRRRCKPLDRLPRRRE